MTPEIAQTIVLTFLSELDIAKQNFQVAQVNFKVASDALDQASIRLTAISNIKENLLQFPDIMDAIQSLQVAQTIGVQNALS